MVTIMRFENHHGGAVGDLAGKWFENDVNISLFATPITMPTTGGPHMVPTDSYICAPAPFCLFISLFR